MLRRSFLSIMLASVLAIGSVFSTGCDKGSLLSNADDVLFSLKQAKPLIATLLPNSEAKIDQALQIAQKLRDAVATSQSTEAVGYLSDLIVVFQDIVKNDIPQIQDPKLRATLLTALALADIGLHYLTKHLVNTPSALLKAGKPSAVVLFDAEPVWGKVYPYKKRK